MKNLTISQLLKQAGLTSIVWHITSMNSLIKILSTNKFLSSVAFGTPSDTSINKNKLYYLSTARSLQTAYSSGSYIGKIAIKLDGNKLNQRYKAAPVNYWGIKHAPEMEDRLVTDKPWIPNAKSYILEIRALLPLENIRQDFIDTMEQAEKLAKTSNLPFWIYYDSKELTKTRSTKRFDGVADWKDFHAKTHKVEPPWEYGNSGGSRDFKALNSIVELIKAVENKNLSKLTESAKDLIYNLSYADGWSGMETAVHNFKSNPEARPLIAFIGKMFRIYRVNSFKDFAKTLKDKIDKLKMVF